MTGPLLVLARKEVRSAARRPVYWVSSLVLVAFIVWLNLSTASGAVRQMAAASPEAVEYMLRLYPQMYLMLQPFSLVLLMSLYLFTDIFIMEKAQGRMEMLLASPLRAVDLWLGKCLSIVVLVYPFVIATTAAYLTLWNVVWRGQVAQSVSLPSMPALVLGLIGNPLLAFAVVSLMGLLALLVSSTNGVQLATFFTAFGATFGGAYALSWVREQLAAQGADLVTWTVSGAVLALAAILVGGLGALRHRLDRDRITRSFG